MNGYRLLSYQSDNGPRAGMVVEGLVYDLAAVSGHDQYVSIIGVLNDWAVARYRLQELTDNIGTRSGMMLSEVQLLAPILYPSAIYCAGANYTDHVENMARKYNMTPDPDPHELGLNPWHFMKATRCVVASGATVAIPSEKLDWEGELAVVVGKTTRNVSPDRALEYVAGYTAANDLSARDMMNRPHLADTSPFKWDWIGQKSFQDSCPIGPWLTPADEISDPQNLAIKLWVNGELKQDSNTSNMIFTAAEQIAQLSVYITLHPGDVILTGTPAGVGAERDEFLHHGDTVKVWIEKIGDLVNHFI